MMPYINVTIRSRNVSLGATSYPWYDREPVTNHNSNGQRSWMQKCHNHRYSQKLALWFVSDCRLVCSFFLSQSVQVRVSAIASLVAANSCSCPSTFTTRPFMGTREHLSLPELVLYGTTTAVCCTADVCRWRLRLRMTRSELPFCLGCLHWKFHRGRRGISAVEQELIYHYQWIRYNPAGITG